MKIAVNTRLLLKGKLEGIGWYTFENLSRMTRNNPQHTFYFLFDRPYDSSFIFSDNVVPVVLFPPARHPFLFLIWFEWSVSRFLKKVKPDVFFSPDGYSILSTKIPVFLTIHDINFEHHPKDFPFFIYRYLKNMFPKFAKKATHITTVSNFSKNDVVAHYHVDKEKISVVYNGIREIFGTLEKEEITLVKNQFTEGNPYFLFIGALHARKNIINQLLAFDQFKTETKLPHKYIVVGKKMWWSKQMQDSYELMKHKEDVIFYGHADTLTLKKMYGAATALTFVSVLEGFGIPIVEAFACGTAVITSNTSSMPEVAGDAALIVSPNSVDEIANAMKTIATDYQLRSSLIEKGFERAKLFSWEKSSEELMKLMEGMFIKINI